MASRWDEMTVADLRKYAREHGITLSAGINKQGIIERITGHEDGQQQRAVPEAGSPQPAEQEAAPAPEAATPPAE